MDADRIEIADVEALLVGFNRGHNDTGFFIDVWFPTSVHGLSVHMARHDGRDVEAAVSATAKAMIDCGFKIGMSPFEAKRLLDTTSIIRSVDIDITFTA